MIKTIFKEVFIVLLLTAVIALVLSVLFYDYNPSNKVVPSKTAYKVPDNIKEELEEANIVNDSFGIEGKVYTVEGTDLNSYKKTNTYNPSKQNPYANTSSDATAGNVENTGNNSSSESRTINTQNTSSQETVNTNKNRLK